MRLRRLLHATIALAGLAGGCSHAAPVVRDEGAGGSDLRGAWRSKVQFRTGAFADAKDLEFMYVFHSDGTLTESSNLDEAPPVPPAYGIWRRTGDRTFEAHYEFFTTKAPLRPEELSAAGWSPSGRGVLVERITLAPDGRTWTSSLRYDPLDPAGSPVEGGGDAEGRAERMRF